MFYEESQIEKFLKCPHCKERYNLPKILPCGKVLCTDCLKLVVSSPEFICMYCNETHLILSNKLPTCELRLSLLLKSPEELLIYRGKTAEDLKANLKKILNTTRELNKLLDNGAELISRYCNKLRKKVHSKAEARIEKIRQLKDTMISKINNYELKSIKMFQTQVDSNINLALAEINVFHNQWDDYLKKSKINDDEMNEAIGLAGSFLDLLEVFGLNSNGMLLSNNVLKYEEVELVDEAQFIGTLKFEIDFNELKSIELTKLIPDLQTEQVHNFYADYLGNGLYFTAYQDKANLLTFSILNKDKTVKTCFTHNVNLTFLSHFITNQEKCLILIDYGCDDLFRIFDENLQIKHEIRLKSMELKGANNFFIYLTSSNIGSNSLHIYDWNFKPINSIGQRTSPNEPFYIPTSDDKGIWQIDCREQKYLCLGESYLNIIDEQSGILLRQIQIDAIKFIVNSNNCLILHSDKNKIKFLNFNGNLLNKIELLNYSGEMYDFILDKEEHLSFIHLQDLTLYQLNNSSNFDF